MEYPSIGICIVFFNKADQTIDTVNCFAKSELPVYVLNNGSAHESAARVRSYCLSHANVRYLDNPQNAGCGGGRNILAKQANEDWLFFVDNDITIAGSQWLNNLIAHIRNTPDVDAIVPRIRNVLDNSWVRPVRLTIQDGNAVFLKLRSQFTNVFPGGGSLVQKTTLASLGYYDEDLMAFEDFEFALRALVNGRELRVKQIDDIELLHDHRTVKTPEDYQAAKIRYDVEKVGEAHDKIVRLYGVHLDKNYAKWLSNQFKDMTESRWKRKLVNTFSVYLEKMLGLLVAIINKVRAILRTS